MRKYVLILICCSFMVISGLQAAFNNFNDRPDGPKNSVSGNETSSKLAIVNGDDCTSGTVLTDGVTDVTGDNTAGTLDEDFSGDTGCDPEVYDESVWFEITPLVSGSLVITIENNGGTDPTGDMSIVVTDDTDCDIPLGWFCGDYASEIEGLDVQAYCSAIMGLTYYIQISTEDLMGGQFDITVESMANDTNDDCADATDTGTVNCSDDAMATALINLACPDAEAGNDCIQDTDPAVWYSFTVDAEVPTFSFTGTDVELFEGPCGGVTSLGCAPINNITTNPAITYYVLALDGGNFLAESDYAPLAEDACGSAAPAGVGTTDSYTVCATNDHDLCGGGTTDTDAQTVWFEFTVNANANANLTFSVSGIAPTPASELSIAVFEDCGGDLADEYGTATNCSGGDVELNCVPDGTVLQIAIGTTEAGAGDFELDISQENTTDNDICDGAEDLTELGCGDEFMGEFMGPACPDDDVLGAACAAGQDGEWYTFTASADLVSYSITGSNFELVQGDCATGMFTSISCGAMADIMADASLTYWVVVFDGGDFTITADQDSPANDDCSDAEGLDSGTPSADGTLICADSDVVSACDNDNQIFYTYTTGGVSADLTITVTGNTATTGVAASDVGVVLYVDCGFTVFDDPSAVNCNTLGTDIDLVCIAPNTEITILLTSSAADAGDINISVAEVATASTQANDDCADAVPIGVDGTEPGDTDCANPDHDVCGGTDTDEDYQTVWYSYTVGTDGTDLEITIAGTGDAISLGSASIVVFEDCAGDLADEYDQINGTASVCGGAQVNLNCVPAGDYLIAVGSDLAGEGEFEITVDETIVDVENDECADATVFSSGACPTCDNTCANGTESFCGLDGSTSHDVWFVYEIVNNPTTVTITGTAASATDISIQAYDGCGGMILGEACGSGTDLLLECVTTDVWFVVASADGEEGTFDLSITENAPPSNDLCADNVYTGELTCANTLDGDYLDFACPDVEATCQADTPGVWYSFDASEAVPSFTVTGSNFELFEGSCGSLTSLGCDNVNVDPSDPNTTYFVLVYLDGDFEVSSDVSAPDNDDCSNADTATAGSTPGNNVCSSIDGALPCQAGNVDNTGVWFEYTVPAGVKQITISVASVGANGIMGDIYMGATEGCSATLYPDAWTCSGEDLIISCPDEGDVIGILVGSEAENVGDFELTITEESPTCTYTNDDCADADVFTTDPETNMGEVCMDGCNELACPDDEMDAACGGSVYNVVWFQFTTDDFDDAIETFLVVNLDDMGNFDGTLQLFDGCGGGAIGPCTGNLNLSNMDFPIDPNTTYWIAVGNNDIAQTGGDFELCVELIQGCANDDCEDAILLEDGVTLSTETTNCSMDLEIPDCSQTVDEASAWYTYEVPAGVTALEIEFSTALDPFVVQWSGDDVDCNNPDLDSWIEWMCNETGPFYELCVEEGQIFTFYVSSEPPGGDFDITVTGLPPDDANNPAPENDICDTAIGQSLNDQCLPETITVNNEMACPEIFSIPGGCNVDQDPTVWYSVTLPDDAVAMEFANFSPNLHVSVFEEGCDPLVLIECISSGDADMFIDGLTGGETYLFAVGVPQELSDHTFDVTAVVPPENDTACPTDPNFPPIDLGSGGSYSGSTCCAIGWNDGMADFQNQDCGGASDDNAVWFIVQFDGGSDGISISASTPGGSWSLEVYEITDPNEACDGNLTYQMVWADCAATQGIEIGCPSQDNWFLIKLTSADEDCGDYTVTVEGVDSACDYADICDETSVILNPVTNENFEIDYVCAQGCLDLACPEEQGTTPGNPCVFNNNPTVWMGFTADDLAAQLFTTVTTPGSWQPVWSIYVGDDCDNLIQLGGGMGGAPPCSNQDNTPDLHQIAAESDFDMYWVAISAEGEVDNPYFEFCVATTINAIICLGEFGQECGEDATIEVTDRENDGPLDGPFCPGEEVTVCIDFFYDATESGADWLIGIVPIFGEAWDLDLFDPIASAPGGSDWYEEDGACAPLLQEPVPHLCTYTNDNGDLELCNGLCDACPCTLGMDPLDELPSGWFWVTNGGNAGCDNDCSPGEGWGIGSTTSQINFCMDLVVKEFETEEECLDGGDLQISFQTFSDGVAGCWEDPVGECLLDFAQFGPKWEVDCDLSPPAVAEPELVCSGDEANVEVTIEGGFDGEIFVIIDEDTSPDIEGQSEHEFTGGVGIIDDELVNCGTEIDSAKYIVTAIVEGFNCPGPPVVISIPVIPKIQFDIPELEVCMPYTLVLNANDIISGGLPPYNVEWFENGSTNIGSNTNLSFDVSLNTSFILLQVVDSNGCTDEVEIPITVFAELIPMLTIDSPSACPGDPDPVCALVDLGLGVADDYVWTVTNQFGEEVELDNNANDEYCIDTYDAPPGIYNLCVEVFNDAGCEAKSNVVEFIMHGAPNGIIVPQAGGSCDEEIILCIDFYGDDPDDDDYNNGPDSNGDGIPDIFDLNDDGIPDFAEIIWQTPNGDISTNDLCFTATLDGDYSVLIYTDNNCIGEIEDIEVELPAPEPPTIVDPGPQCEGAMFELLAEPDESGNMYAWTETSSMTDLGMGNPIQLTATVTSTYQVEMTDEQGCVTTASITVVVNPNPVINLAGALEVCAGLQTTLNAGGDAATWMYTWTNTDDLMVVGMNQEVTLSPGNYEIAVVDENNCMASMTFTVTEENMITVIIAGEDICDTGTATLDAGVFDTWQWLDPMGNPLGTDQTQVVDMAGEYTVNITVGGCTGSGTYMVNQVDSPMSPVPPTATACNVDSGNGPTSLDFNSFTSGGSTGTWDNSANPQIDISDLANVDFQGQAAGMYVFEFTTNSAVLPCVDTTYVLTVTVDDCSCPNPNVSDPGPLCSDNDTLDLTTLYLPTTDPGSWQVISGPGNPEIINDSLLVATGESAGVYELEYTVDMPGGGNCVNSDVIQLTINEPPTMTFDVPAVMCNVLNSSIGPSTLDLNGLILTGSGFWQDPMIPDALFNAVAGTIDFDGVTPGVYEIFVTTNNAETPCPEATYSIMVEVIDCNCPDTPQFQDPPTLCNDGIPYDLSDLFIGQTFDGSWGVVTQPPGGNLVINADNTVTIGGMVEGDYILMFTLNDDPGPDCPTEFTLEPLVIIEQPTAGDDGFTTLCMGDPDMYILIDLIDGEDNGGIWTDISIDGPSAGSFDALAGTFDASGESPGTYTFQYEIVPDPPCSPVVAIVEVVVEDLPVVDAGDQQMLTCENNQAELGDPSGTIQGAGVTYEWTEMSDPTTVIGTDLEISVNQGGTYVLTVIDQNGCINSDMVLIDAAGNIPSYDTDFTDSPCFGESSGSLSFENVQGGDGNYQYSIDGGQTFSSQTDYTNLAPGTYDLLLVDGDGCEIPDQVVISEPDLLTADAGDDQAIILGTANTMSVTVPGVDPSIITNVIWTDNDGNIVCEGDWDACNTIEVNVTQTTTYTVTVETETGCRASDNIRLNIAIVMDCFVPNIFSTESTDPNNTFFFMTCDEFAEAITEFYIYDRWGNLVFTAENIQPNDPSVGWDGKFNGSSVEQGVYVYLIKVKFFDVPDLEIYAGDITVVR